MLSSTSTSEPLPAFTDEDAFALFPDPPKYTEVGAPTRLALPVCVPQVNTSFDSPFLRAYPPALANHGIGQEDWLKWQDGLNLATIGSPALQVADKVGMVVGFVPNEWTMVAGIAIQTVAQTGQHVISKTLTDRYLRQTNEDFFAPRGLVVRLAKTPGMRALVDSSAPAAPSKLASFGKAAQSIGLHLPIIRKVIVRLADPAPVIPIGGGPNGGDIATRKVTELMNEGLIEKLTFSGLGEVHTPPGVADKFSDLAIKLRKSKEARKEGKNERNRRLLAIREGQTSEQGAPFADYVGWEGRKERRAARRAQKDARKGRGPNGKSARKLRLKVAIADRKEYLAGDRLVWIVVLNKEDDEKIEGRDAVDEKGDFLKVDDDDWEEELEIEEEEEEIEALGLGGFHKH